MYEDKILITTVERLKELTSISDNIDPTMLEPYLFSAQELYVEELLGVDMYNDVLNNIVSGTTKYDFLIKNYLDYIIAYGSWSLAAPFLNYKTQRKGIVKQTSDYSDSVTVDEYVIYAKKIENMVSFYIRKTYKYLNDNVSSYPLYEGSKKNTNSSSIFLGFK